MHTRLIGIAVLFLVYCVCFAQEQKVDNTSARIDAITEFLLERARANYLAVFEQRIKENDTVRCNFPTIYSYIEDGNLRLLLKSRNIWKEAVNHDLEAMLARAVGDRLNELVDFRKAALEASDQFIEVAQFIELEQAGRRHPLSLAPTDLSAAEKAFHAGFYDDALTLRDTFLSASAVLERKPQGCALNAVTPEDIRKIVDSLATSLAALTRWQAHLAAHKDQLKVNRDQLAAFCANKPGAPPCQLLGTPPEQVAGSTMTAMLTHADRLRAADQAIREHTAMIDHLGNHTEKALTNLKRMQQYGLHQDIASFDKFKKHILFFAEIADAQDKDEIKEILTAYTVPPVSFTVKRERHQEHFIVSAFIGLSGAAVRNDETFGNDNRYGIYAPLGVEYSRGIRDGNSLSIMLAPFDFGYPISLKLNGIEENVELREIVAPSLAISYGLRDYPLTVGAALQKGRKSATGSASEERMLFFLAFDMPLWTLY